MEMSIAAMSVGMSQQNFRQDLGVSVMKMAMDQMQEQGAALTELMDVSSAAATGLGVNLDILA